MARRYPDIDWENFRARIAQPEHIKHLKEIPGGKKKLFKDIYAQVIMTKKAQRKQTPGSRAGYYGTRDSRAMLEGIYDNISALLRDRAVKDELVSARGHAVYVEAVLVPELAVRLVMEGMGVGVERVREVFEESRDVGDVLCVDEGDIVHDFDEDDPNWF